MVQKKELFHKIDICLPETPLKKGSSNCTNNKARINEKNTVSNDSLKNCITSCFLNDPIAFRIPTSFALFSERAVLRFIKLIQASNKTKTPMIPNIQTYWMAPPVFTPFLNSEYKCQRLIGCRNRAGFFWASLGFTFFSFASLILAETVLKSALSFSSTNKVKAFGLQGSSMVLIQSVPL